MDFDTWKLGDIYTDDDDTITCMFKASNGKHEYDIYLFADGRWDFVERIDCEGYTVPRTKLSEELLEAIAKRDKEEGKKMYHYEDMSDDGKEFFIVAYSESEAHDKAAGLFGCVRYFGEISEEEAKRLGYDIY